MPQLSRAQIGRNILKSVSSSGVTSHSGGVLSVAGKKVNALDYAHKSMTQITKDLRAKGLDSTERRKIVSVITGADALARQKIQKDITKVGAFEQHRMIDKAIASDSYAKDLVKTYGDKAAEMVSQKREHIERIKRVSIGTIKHEEAQKMLQERIDEQNKIEFGKNNNGKITPGKSSNYPMSPDNYGLPGAASDQINGV